jgi:hypothetical protein
MHGTSIRHALTVKLLGILAVTVMTGMPSFAGDGSLISLGPRVGFSGKSPFLGREQKHNFHLTDIAAVWRLPWTWQIGASSWQIGTRLTTSAGHLAAAGDSGVMATLVPTVALSGWHDFMTLDIGGGVGFFSRDTFGRQDLGGPIQAIATVGIQVHPFAHAYAGFRVQHFSDAGIYGASGLGVDMYLVEIGYRF